MSVMKNFDKFENCNVNIFTHYNKKSFRLPKCANSGKKCSCFNINKDFFFSFDYPMSAIQLMKNNLKKIIIETEKHNNANIISLSQIANLTKRHSVKRSIKDHKNTLEVFKIYYERKIKKKNISKHIRYMIYIDNQILKCEKFLIEYVTLEKEDLVPIIILLTSLFAHYHTLKLFEHFIIK